MVIRTSRGLEYAVLWIDQPIQDESKLLLEMVDERRIRDIVPEFEGLFAIERFSIEQGDKRYEGYSHMRSIRRQAGGTVLIELGRDGE